MSPNCCVFSLLFYGSKKARSSRGLSSATNASAPSTTNTTWTYTYPAKKARLSKMKTYQPWNNNKRITLLKKLIGQKAEYERNIFL